MYHNRGVTMPVVIIGKGALSTAALYLIP